LFRSPVEELLCNFLDRLFRLPAVSRVNIDRDHRTVSVCFDHLGNDPRDVLRGIAALLSAENDGRGESVFHAFLASVPGRIHRVEREIAPGHEAFTVFSVGDGFIARAQQCVARTVFEPQPDSGEQETSSERVFVIAQEVIVEYEPESEPTAGERRESAEQAPGLVVLGARRAMQRMRGQSVRMLDGVRHYGRRLATLPANWGSAGASLLRRAGPFEVSPRLLLTQPNSRIAAAAAKGARRPTTQALLVPNQLLATGHALAANTGLGMRVSALALAGGTLAIFGPVELLVFVLGILVALTVAVEVLIPLRKLAPLRVSSSRTMP
jgi:hypothetical protein